jgi:hypothetical protein
MAFFNSQDMLDEEIKHILRVEAYQANSILNFLQNFRRFLPYIGFHIGVY